MTWFADLTPYTYVPSDDGAVNVGWLGRGHDFERGPTGGPLRHDLFVDRLSAAAASPCPPYCMGKHRCDLCEGPDAPMGTAEVRVDSPDGVTLAAPQLVAHYVADHGYRPPERFVEAVLAGRFHLPPPWERGDVVGTYAPRSPLDDRHQRIAAAAAAKVAGVTEDVVLEQMTFLVDHVLVHEDGSERRDLKGTPRLRVGFHREGLSFDIFNDGPHWDGTATSLQAIIEASLSAHTLD